MRVMIFVEGPSDKVAMNALLGSLIAAKKQQGIQIDFFESPPGDKKKTLLTKSPQKAAQILSNDSKAVVIIMPDLYPKNKGFEHTTVEELRAGIFQNFQAALIRGGIQNSPRLMERLRVFCFKHDLEALILASGEALSARLGLKSLKQKWVVPVEDQNHDNPPRRVVEELFRECKKKICNHCGCPPDSWNDAI